MAAFARGKGLAKGFFWGGLIGVVIGILITAKRDNGTWEEIGKSADALVDKTKEQIRLARKKMEERANPEKDSCAGEQESLTGDR
jgi:prolipoprotein diacylglyceryltransferase